MNRCRVPVGLVVNRALFKGPPPAWLGGIKPPVAKRGRWRPLSSGERQELLADPTYWILHQMEDATLFSLPHGYFALFFFMHWQ